MKCIIVDDEPIARDIIVSFCSHFPALEIIGVCTNILEARNILQVKHVELMFLDIHMPVLDGMSFYKSLRNPPPVIFTTAYKEYATQAFDVEAIDYLVKPFSLDRFILALDRMMAKISKLNIQTAPPQSITQPSQPLFIRSDGRIHQLSNEEILYAEANGNYTNIVTSDSVISPIITLASFATQVSQTLFIQVHRSFIVNQSKINHIEGNIITIGKFKIPIGNHYRDAFLKKIGLSL